MSSAALAVDREAGGAWFVYWGNKNIRPAPIDVHDCGDGPLFLARPIFGSLLFDNNSSDARDHCANERTFLSWLRLAIYLAIVSVAIVISFHLKHQPSPIELRIARPLGIVFWILALACLVSGYSNYITTVRKYSHRQALVQSGWKTQVVFTIIAIVIVGVCVLFLSTNAKRS